MQPFHPAMIALLESLPQEVAASYLTEFEARDQALRDLEEYAIALNDAQLLLLVADLGESMRKPGVLGRFREQTRRR